MKNVLEFLNNLRLNNNREWMQQNRPACLEAKGEFQALVRLLIDRIKLFDPEISGIRPENCIFRLNRDIRFSKDKRPYKENFGAFISKSGKKGVDGGYYIHIEPGRSMAAGGSYMPPMDILKKIRQEIDYNPDPLNEFINSDPFRQYFGRLEGEKLKTAPKGYNPDHQNINLINHKSYIVTHSLDDNMVAGDSFPEYVVEVFTEMKPLNDYLRMAIHD